MLVASAVSPLAETCPSFTGPEVYTCTGAKGAPPYPLKIKSGTVNGVASYAIEWSGAARTVVVGQSMAKGKDTTIAASCRPVQSMRTKAFFDTLILSTKDSAGNLQGETQIRSEGKSVVVLTYGAQGENGGLVGMNVCRPVHSHPAAPAAPAASSSPAAPAAPSSPAAPVAPARP